MAANQFLPFATSAGALVLTPANYAVLANRPLGFQPGIAQANECNSVWRQSSFIAAVVAQFVTNQTGLDVLDDGDLNGKVALLLAAIQAAAAALPDNDAAIALSTAIAVRDAQVNLFTVFASSTTAFVVPANINYMPAEVTGGGAAGGTGGGSVGGGGGAGAFGKIVIPVTPGETLTMVVGSGGVFGGAAATASIIYRGATPLVTANPGNPGGPGAGAGTVGSSGTGGTAATTLASNFSSHPGGIGTYGIYEDGVHYISMGGISFGSGNAAITSGSTTLNTPGANGYQPGGGASGGIGTGPGGNGYNGLIRIGM